MVPRAVNTALLVTLIALVGATSASATQRFTSPTGTATTGTGCPEITPCSLSNAASLANSNPGDELVLAGGDYLLGVSTLVVSGSIDMFGPGAFGSRPPDQHRQYGDSDDQLIGCCARH